MYKQSDFDIDAIEFRFKKDAYPIKRIHDVRVKRLSFLDNLGQIVFWIALFSGALWLAIPDIKTAPTWLQIITGCLTALGFAFAMFRCSRYALQVEFRHVDETGLQWVNVAKTFSHQDADLFAAQAETLKARL